MLDPHAVRTASGLQVALACVAYMESGLDIDPSDLERVFAFAFEDSIYVSMKVRGHLRMLGQVFLFFSAPRC